MDDRSASGTGIWSYTWWKTGIGDGYQPKHEKMREKKVFKNKSMGATFV